MANTKNWRVNILVNYRDTYAALHYRELIVPVLNNLSLLKGIECAWEYERKFDDNVTPATDNCSEEIVTDILYCRALPQTQMSAKQFRDLVKNLSLSGFFGFGDPYDVGFQLQSALPLYPFPQPKNR